MLVLITYDVKNVQIMDREYRILYLSVKWMQQSADK